MPDASEVPNEGQNFVSKAVDTMFDTVFDTFDAIKSQAPSLERVTDLFPTPAEVMDQVTATANELLSLTQDIQNKVIAALKSNA